jgi:hypothetical protein
MAMQINEMINAKGLSSKKISYPVYNPAIALAIY